MQFQWTDLVVAVIMVISGLLALARGFTREVLSLIAWGVAGLAGLASALNPQIVAAAQQYIPQEIAAKIAVGAGVFLVVLIIMSLISIKISDWVLDAPVGLRPQALDVVEHGRRLDGEAGRRLEAQHPPPGVDGVAEVGRDERLAPVRRERAYPC